MTEETIFSEALEKGAGHEREAFLNEACHGDAILRRQVDSLLEMHEGAESLLAEPISERLAKQLLPAEELGETKGSPEAATNSQSLGFLNPSDKSGSLGRLGSYEIKEVIGHGGMGIVLRAFDEKLHRVVAIKVMTAPLATNEHARRRFVREGRPLRFAAIT